jgi:hypothetical protein
MGHFAHLLVDRSDGSCPLLSCKRQFANANCITNLYSPVCLRGKLFMGNSALPQKSFIHGNRQKASFKEMVQQTLSWNYCNFPFVKLDYLSRISRFLGQIQTGYRPHKYGRLLLPQPLRLLAERKDFEAMCNVKTEQHPVLAHPALHP